MMKRLFTVILLSFGIGFALQAQTLPVEPDKSPMDMSYHPFGYPILKVQNPRTTQSPKARVIYSRPQKNGRTVFGGIVPFGDVWRLGANENTEIEFFQAVHIANKRIEKGRYSLFAIPQEGKWTIILNKNLDSWGSFSYDSRQDVLRTEVSTSGVESPFEFFTMLFDGNGSLIMAWDNIKAILPIRYSGK